MEPSKQKKEGRWKLLLIVAVCAAPVIASYFTYYVIKPTARTNYGDLLDPRNYPIPQLGATTLDGQPAALDAYKGKWIMLQVNDASCLDACKGKLLDMRQVRLMQGKEMDRIERVWRITDDQPLDTQVMREYDGTHMLRVKRAALAAWLPVEAGGALADYIYIVDPLGNLMMAYAPDARAKGLLEDMKRLLKLSHIG